MSPSTVTHRRHSFPLHVPIFLISACFAFLPKLPFSLLHTTVWFPPSARVTPSLAPCPQSLPTPAGLVLSFLSAVQRCLFCHCTHSATANPAGAMLLTDWRAWNTGLASDTCLFFSSVAAILRAGKVGGAWVSSSPRVCDFALCSASACWVLRVCVRFRSSSVSAVPSRSGSSRV